MPERGQRSVFDTPPRGSSPVPEEYGALGGPLPPAEPEEEEPRERRPFRWRSQRSEEGGAREEPESPRTPVSHARILSDDERLSASTESPRRAALPAEGARPQEAGEVPARRGGPPPQEGQPPARGKTTPPRRRRGTSPAAAEAADAAAALSETPAQGVPAAPRPQRPTVHAEPAPAPAAEPSRPADAPAPAPSTEAPPPGHAEPAPEPPVEPERSPAPAATKVAPAKEGPPPEEDPPADTEASVPAAPEEHGPARSGRPDARARAAAARSAARPTRARSGPGTEATATTPAVPPTPRRNPTGPRRRPPVAPDAPTDAVPAVDRGRPGKDAGDRDAQRYRTLPAGVPRDRLDERGRVRRPTLTSPLEREPRPAAYMKETVRSRQVIRHVDLTSVFRVSLLFYSLGMLALILAGIVLWNVASALGTITSIDKSIKSLFDLKNFALHPLPVLGYGLAAGVVLVIAGTLLNVVFGLIFNLISDVTGGVIVRVVSEPDDR